MTEYTKISKELVIEDDIRDSHGGELFGTIKIGNPSTNEAYGYVDYSLLRMHLNPATDKPAKFGDVFYIKMIKVFDKHQTKGYAKLMMNYIKKKYRGYKIDTGMVTEDGANFMRRKK